VHVFEFFASVVDVADLLKVAFDHVDVIFIDLVAHSRVSDDADSKLVEAFDNVLALDFPARLLVEVLLHVDDGGFVQLWCLYNPFGRLCRFFDEVVR